MRIQHLLIGLAVFLLPLVSWSQESTNFRLNEHAVNAGGTPEGGVSLTSSNFKITLASIGDTVGLAATFSSPGYQGEAGFAAPYPPPGEVDYLRFPDNQTLAWLPEPSVGKYNLYRGFLSGLPTGYGVCEQAGLGSYTATDASIPPAGESYFYLVTAENRLEEEGTTGDDSSPAERPNAAPCP